uniref:(northern house mosquito) hypothetical protein n=1 Tax=Culex pipiens TaxID=7175 RepID=A0A8D8PIL7_CULPI
MWRRSRSRLRRRKVRINRRVTRTKCWSFRTKKSTTRFDGTIRWATMRLRNYRKRMSPGKIQTLQSSILIWKVSTSVNRTPVPAFTRPTTRSLFWTVLLRSSTFRRCRTSVAQAVITNSTILSSTTKFRTFQMNSRPSRRLKKSPLRNLPP